MDYFFFLLAFLFPLGTFSCFIYWIFSNEQPE